MNAVLFYSNTGQSLSIAKFFSKKLSYPLVDVTKVNCTCFENAVLVFPVYCQNIPETVRIFLSKIKIDNLTAIATYGRMSRGNVLYEVQKKYGMNIVAAAYVPTKHTYIDGDVAFNDLDSLMPIVEKVKNPAPIKLPKLYKNPLANFFPKLRSRLGVKIRKNSNCNACGTCEKNCSYYAIKDGVVNNKCIRCLKCVKNCPNGALEFKVTLPMKVYLRKKKINKLTIYI